MRRISAHRWQATLGSASFRRLKFSIFVNGPYPTPGIAAMALRALPHSMLAFRGWKYVVVGPRPEAYGPIESVVATCLTQASGRHFHF